MEGWTKTANSGQPFAANQEPMRPRSAGIRSLADIPRCSQINEADYYQGQVSESSNPLSDSLPVTRRNELASFYFTLNRQDQAASRGVEGQDEPV